MNKDLFFDLFHGNYRPDEALPESSDKIQKLTKAVEDAKKKLSSKLSEDDDLLLREIDDSYKELIDLYSLDAYISGIHLATNFLFNALSNDKNSEEE